MEPRRVIGGGGLMVSLRLPGKHVLVVGAGKEAVGRVFFALDADALVTILAPLSTAHPELRARIARREVVHLDRAYEGPQDLLNPETNELYDLVLGCLEDAGESRLLAEDARMNRVAVNCADVPELCDFFFVATHRDGPIQIGVSTNGCGPRMAARIRTHIKETLPRGSREAVERIGHLRQLVRASDPVPESAARRMMWLSRLCDQWSVEEMASIGETEVLKLLEAYEKGEKPPPPAGVTGRGLVNGSPRMANGSLNGGSSSSEDNGESPALPRTAAAEGSPVVSSSWSVTGLVRATAGLAYATATAPYTLTAAAAGATLGAARRATTLAHTAADVAATYATALAATGASTAAATVDATLHLLPTVISTPARRVITAVVPRPWLPLSDGRPAVALIGAGPGDPNLLTLRASELLRSADVVVADQLLAPAVLALVPKRKLVMVEKKTKGRSDAAQEDAVALCLERLRKGLRVVRLKGGDPFLFGRGGEEVLQFREAGFEPEVVPGVSSCIAVPESVGIPVTHRGVADQLLVLSARGEGGSFPEIPAHHPRRTTVVLMPVARIGALVDLFTREAGYPMDTPAAVVERGTFDGGIGARVVEGRLEEMEGRVREAKVGSPALLVVGDVCEVLRREGGVGGLSRGGGGAKGGVPDVGR